jgi:hypothetical protein
MKIFVRGGTDVSCFYDLAYYFLAKITLKYRLLVEKVEKQ